MLKNKTVVVGVTGGIAAYKSAAIVSRLKALGAEVWVAMTREAAEFVGPLTFRTLSGNPVISDLFSKDLSTLPLPHISLAKKADLILIAPATANLIGKIAGGIADDALTTIVMASPAKKLIAPAMNCQMWRSPFLQKNIGGLRAAGYEFVGPVEGKLACGEDDIGRMAEPEIIVDEVVRWLGGKQDFKGRKVLVTAGGTREAIDPVRYLANRSSGKMGYALAAAARERGAGVTLVAANVNLPAPLDLRPVRVESAAGMLEAVLDHYSQVDTVVMAAAVADYKSQAPNHKSEIPKLASLDRDPDITSFQNINVVGTKLKSKTLNLKLAKNQDILKTLSRQPGRRDRFIVGFALETENLLQNAKRKLRGKDLDLMVANGPASFGSDQAKVTLLFKDGGIEDLPPLPKKEVAGKVLDAVLRL